jgi:hypothetical protein
LADACISLSVHCEWGSDERMRWRDKSVYIIEHFSDSTIY